MNKALQLYGYCKTTNKKKKVKARRKNRAIINSEHRYSTKLKKILSAALPNEGDAIKVYSH